MEYQTTFVVFSTYVEMILLAFVGSYWWTSVLHVCGDDPNNSLNWWATRWCSPRMWRWSYWLLLGQNEVPVFSTYVEMILLVECDPQSLESVLHVCGDDPNSLFSCFFKFSCSPRMWRWSFISFQIDVRSIVFSTYVEMILWSAYRLRKWRGVLHVCGDDPRYVEAALNTRWCSPRMWRWSCQSRWFS